MSASIIPPGRLECGIQLPVQAQSRIFVEPWEAEAGAPELARVITKADEIGLFYVAVCDHVAVPREAARRMGTTWWDTVATLSWAAALTSQVRLLSHVLVAGYRPPLVTAKAFLTLDEISTGRAVLGVGVGHVEGEFAALGADHAERGAVTDEAVDVIRAAFTDEYVTRPGPRFPADDVGLAPRGHQERIPIWIGGSSKPAMRRAAERGDGWLPQGTPRDEMPAAIAFILEHRRATLGDTPIDIGTLVEPMYVGNPGWDVGPWTVAGPADRLADHLRGLREMGVGHAQVRLRSRTLDEQLDQLDAFAEVLAQLNP